MAIFNKKIETLPRDELEQLQIERLQITLNRVYRNVAFYKERFDSQGVDLKAIQSIADLKALPLTTKADVRQSAPYNLFAVPLRDIVRIHSTAGTTGQPVGVGYTHNDLRHWSTMIARLLAAADVTEHDFIQIAFPYGLMTGGLGFHNGAELLGASVIPASGEDVRRQIAIMKNFKTTVLVGRPGYALAIANALAEAHIHPEQLHLRCGLFGSEPWSETQRQQIEERLHLKAYDSYGLSEIIGPGVAGECQERNGLHINEDHFLAEIIDPKTLEPLPRGNEGELVFTTLTKEGFPLIRYRTGDMARLLDAPCPCGRTFLRMSRVMGRTDDMIFFEDSKFFPSQIEAILLQEKGVAPSFQLVFKREANADILEIHAEISRNDPLVDEIKGLERMRERLTQTLLTQLGVKAKLMFVQPSSIIHAGVKNIIPVIDQRGK